MTQPVFEQRWDRARKEMQQRGLDALLVGDKYNYWYFTGHLSREFDKKMRPIPAQIGHKRIEMQFVAYLGRDGVSM